MPFNSAQQFIKENNISQFISFNDGQSHRVTLKDSAPATIKDPRTKETLQGLSWKVIENGEEKSFFTRSVMLIQKLNAFNPGDKVVVTMKKAPNADGQLRTSYTVKAAESSSDEVVIVDQDTPITSNVAEDDIDPSQIPF